MNALPAGNPGVRTVVLCDDQQVLRDAVSLLLTNFPRYRVVGEATDATSCVQAIVDFTPDILIMDVSLPGGGPDLVRQARAHRADMHIVMFSGRHEASVQADMIAAGANFYVIKTGRLKPLIEALDRCGPLPSEREENDPTTLPAVSPGRPVADHAAPPAAAHFGAAPRAQRQGDTHRQPDPQRQPDPPGRAQCHPGRPSAPAPRQPPPSRPAPGLQRRH